MTVSMREAESTKCGELCWHKSQLTLLRRSSRRHDGAAQPFQVMRRAFE